MKRRLSLLLAILMLISVMCVAPVTASAADAYTVYCINSAKWDEVCAYAWGGGSMSWPGKTMTKTGETINGYDVYAYTTNTAYANVIFNNNDKGSQTKDLTWTDGQYYDVKEGKWYASLQDIPVVDPLATDVYLVGEFNDWSTIADEFKRNAEGDKIGTVTLTLEAEKTYQFKVVREGKWTSNKTTVTDTVEGLVFSSSVSDNAKLTTTFAGDYVFTWDTSKSQLSVEYPEAVVETTTQAPVETDPVETTTAAPVETDPVETTTFTPDRYTVAGDFLNPAWDPSTNDMTYGEYVCDGKTYDYAFTAEVKEGTYNFKVTNGSWDVAYPNNNFTLDVTATGTVTIYFNSTTCEIAVDGEYINNSEFVVNSITAVGNGDGTWLNGVIWDPADSSNYMTEVAPGVYEITYYNMDAYDDYQVKFAVNDGWSYNWGIDGVFDSQYNISQIVEQDGSTVTIRIDINGFNFETKEGPVVTEWIVTPPVEEEKVEIAGYSLTLSGNIGVNFFLKLSDAVLADADAKVVFTYADKTVEVAVADGIYDEATGFYKFTCEVPAKDMATDINCKVVSGGKESGTFTQSVKDYAEFILLNAEQFPNEVPLVKAMLNYGAAAQTYFGYNTDNLANETEYMTDDDRYVVPLSFETHKYTLSGEEAGVTYYGTALSLKSELAIKHYFIIDESVVDVDSLVISCGYAAEIKKNGNLYEVKISGIPAHFLGEAIVLELGGLTMEYSPFAYGVYAEESGNENLWNVMNTMYPYYCEALAYYYISII